jgi:hypothetical protein
MIDRKHWLSRDQIKALSKEDAIEFYTLFCDNFIEYSYQEVEDDGVSLDR